MNVMSFPLWKWGSWWPSRKTQQCRLTAGRVNNSSQPSQLGLVAKQLPPWSYIICKRNIFFFFANGIQAFWMTGVFHLDVFDLQLAWGKLDVRVASQRLSSCSGQREWLHPIRGGFGEKDKKAICAVFLSSHGIPGQLWHGLVSPCGFSRGL